MEINKCYYCMEDMNAGSEVCPHCGKRSDELRQSEFALQPGMILHGKYLIGAVLGQGGFGITYMGYDLSLGIKVAVKEYYPTNMASRSRSGGVLWSSKATPKEEGCSNFLKEARKMAKLMNIPEIVRVNEIFQDNDTAYIVMDFVEGITLKEKLKRDGIMSEAEAAALLGPIAEALDRVHRQGIIHRDISPDNIMIDREGCAKLLDLGAAKEIDMRSSEDRQSSQMIHKDGFSPPEQYTTGGSIGAWTDVYAMSATFLYCVTGLVIPPAMDRLFGKTPVGYSDDITPLVRDVLEKGLSIEPEERYQTIGEFWADLTKNLKSSKKRLRHAGAKGTATVSAAENSEKNQAEKTAEQNGNTAASFKGAGSAGSNKDSLNSGAKIKKAVLIAVPVLAAVIAAAILIPSAMYSRAVGYLDAGQYDNAVQTFEKLGGYRDSKEQLLECYCLLADELYNNVEYEDAVKVYEKAAEQGFAEAQYHLGVCYNKGKGVNQDNEEAAKWIKKAAMQGHAEAQSNLGLCYSNGIGVAKNNEEAVKWFKMAAEQGFAEAQHNVGVCYANGYGVSQDNEEAVKWFEKAAEQGDASAQYNLGISYYYGYGVSQDNEEAVKWFKKAAEQGDASAQYNLGVCYYNGYGVSQDYEEAVKWYEKAAWQGHASAQYNLGISYYYGYGVSKDNEEAAKWFEKAAKQGNEKAQNYLNEMK